VKDWQYKFVNLADFTNCSVYDGHMILWHVLPCSSSGFFS